MSKQKVLITGSVHGDYTALHKKLTTLTTSKAGPFNVCFCTGPFFTSTEISDISVDLNFPVPVYFSDVGVPPPSIGVLLEDATNPYKTKTTTDGTIQIAPNLFYLGSKTGLTTISNTVVAWVGKNPTSADVEKVVSMSKHPSFLGCDLLLSSEWGQGILSVIPQSSLDNVKSLLPPNAFINHATFGDCDISEIASCVRPRYHFATTHGVHLQGNPYRNISSSSALANKKYHVTRFIAMSSVTSDATDNKDKRRKWIHAVGIESLTYMDRDTLLLEPGGTVNSPYTDEGFEKVGVVVYGDSQKSYGISESSARSIIMKGEKEEQFRWAGRGVDNNAQNKRRREENSNNTAVDTSIDTLWIGGLDKDTSGLVTAETLMSELQEYNPITVRLPAGMKFGFVVFGSHDEAKLCIEKTNAGVNIGGVFLQIKWAASKSQPPRQQQQDSNTNDDNKRQKATLLEKDCPTSESLFFMFPRTIPQNDFEEVMEVIRKLAEKLIEDAINGDGEGEGSERITAADEPSLKVTAKLAVGGKGFGFLGFANHAAAALAIAAFTGSTDGGNLSDDVLSGREGLGKLSLFWSNNDMRDNEPSTVKKQAPTGLNFTRVRTKETRTDCWFCLSSPTCEKHLLVAVGERAYVAMPKGPLCPTHSLIIPAEHQSTGALIGAASGEIEIYKNRLRDHAKSVGMELYVFERSIETKGGLHTHVNAIPMSPEAAMKLRELSKNNAKRLDLNLREVQSDIGVRAIVKDLGVGCGYFFMEIPSIMGEPYRMIIIHDPAVDVKCKIPVQFGRELAAQAMGCPEKAVWKECELGREEEESVAMEFRKGFASFAEA